VGQERAATMTYGSSGAASRATGSPCSSAARRRLSDREARYPTLPAVGRRWPASTTVLWGYTGRARSSLAQSVRLWSLGEDGNPIEAGGRS
jgi:hypothetical protein